MQRFATLDALRGLAALSVFMSHIHGVLFDHHRRLIDLSPAYLLWSGSEAVILFFVLSGFVLVRRAQVGAPQTYATFLAVRFIRIGVPHLFVLLCCLMVVYALAAYGVPPSTIEPWPTTVAWPLVRQHMMMVGNYNSMAFNNVVWTLVHELRFALLFPLFMLMIRWIAPARLLTGLFGVSLLAAAYLSWVGDSSEGYRSAYVYTAHYMLMFVMGGLLVTNLDALTDRWLKLPPSRRRHMVIGALGVYIYARLLFMVPQQMGWQHAAVFNVLMADDLVAVASCVLMLAAVAQAPLTQTPMKQAKWQAWLHGRLAQYLGRVSFSLYLVHMPVLKTCLALWPDVPAGVVMILVVPTVFVLAHALHHGVEMPAQRAARHIGTGRRTRPELAEEDETALV